jgi:hypothetical protein
MFCDEVLERVDAIASGDDPGDARLSSHVAACPGCATALEDARRLERLLVARPVPQPPPQFTGRLLTRIRRERWRREQFFDTAFNVSIGLVLLFLVAAAWTVLDRSGFPEVTRSTAAILRQQLVDLAQRVAPSLGLYAAAAALIGAALGLWWWAERP